jgi:translation initiation factor IF-3
VRLIGADGNQLGIRPLPEALNMARELELDLVEVADKANPPVCRIMDYGKYRYEAAQKAKESRRKSTNVVVKEMKYRPKIGAGDFGTKTRKVEKFLGEGHKVKVTIMFRGREMQHPELGRRILDQVAQAVDDVGRVEIFPKQDGRNMTMVLAPDKKAQAAAAADKKKAAEDEAEAATGSEDPIEAAVEAELAEEHLVDDLVAETEEIIVEAETDAIEQELEDVETEALLEAEADLVTEADLDADTSVDGIIDAEIEAELGSDAEDADNPA